MSARSQTERLAERADPAGTRRAIISFNAQHFSSERRNAAAFHYQRPDS